MKVRIDPHVTRRPLGIDLSRIWTIAQTTSPGRKRLRGRPSKFSNRLLKSFPGKRNTFTNWDGASTG